MKTPRNLNGAELVKALKKVGYSVVHQRGSHIIVRTHEPKEHTVPVPNHKPLKVGTLDAILKGVADHFGISKEELMNRIF